MNNAALPVYRRGNFAAVPCFGGGYQVVNLSTGKRSQPRSRIRAMRILIKTAR